MANLPGLLPGVRVLDIGRGVSGPYCGKVLAGLGAEVIKVEPPEGDEARTMGPFPGDVPDSEKSGLFLALNANKLGVTLDLASSQDVRALLRLAETAHIVIENHQMGVLEGRGLSYQAFSAANASIVLTSITPFGTWGPYAAYKAPDLVLSHLSGDAQTHTATRRQPGDDPPARPSGHQAELVAGLSAATATLMLLYSARASGKGGHVVVSSFEAMVNQRFGRLVDPQPAAQPGPSLEKGRSGPLPCEDGHVVISPRQDAQWARWLGVMGEPGWASDPRFATGELRRENASELWELQSRWTGQHTKRDVARWAQQSRVPCFPVNGVADLLQDGQLAHRRFFADINHPVAGRLKYAGLAYRASNPSLTVGARPAPLLGEHNNQVLGVVA